MKTPEKIEMPAATAWPLVLAFGFTLVFAGFVTAASVSILGAALVVAGTVGWFRQVLPVESHELARVSRPSRGNGSRVMKAGSRLAPSINSPRARRAWRVIGIRSPMRRMEKRPIFRAGCVTSMAIVSRYSRSTARTWAVPCDGFRNRDSSCALVTAALTTRMVRAPRDRQSADSSSMNIRFPRAAY